MKRTGIVAAMVWLAAVGGLAQQETDPGPVMVETLLPVPTVVKTGDRITQTYRVRFPELVERGKEIILLEDRMAPENLPVHPFEGVGLAIRKTRVGDEHVWDLTYQFRIVNPAKSSYVLPNFGIYWLMRDLGQEIEEAEVRQIDTAPVLIRYVTTITEQPVLDIRDTIELGNYGAAAATWRIAAWILGPLPLLLWVIAVVRLARRPKPVSIQMKTAAELDQLEAALPPPPTVWEARRALRRQLRALGAVSPGENGRVLLDLERGLVISFRDYLRAELPELNSGDTAREIKRYIETRLRESPRKQVLLDLAARLVAHQSALEIGSPRLIEDPGAEAQAVSDTLAQLRPHVRAWRRVTELFGRS